MKQCIPQLRCLKAWLVFVPQCVPCFSHFIDYSSQPPWKFHYPVVTGEKREAQRCFSSVPKQECFRANIYFFIFTPELMSVSLKTIDEFNMWYKKPGFTPTNTLTVPSPVRRGETMIWTTSWSKNTWEINVSNWQEEKYHAVNSFKNNHHHNMVS